MFKWVAGLCAAIYVTLLVFGAPPEGQQEVATIEAPKPVEVTEAIDVVTRNIPEPVATVETIEAPDPTDTVTLVEAVQTVALNSGAQRLLIQEPELPAVVEEIVTAAATRTLQQSVAPLVEQETAAVESTGIGEIWRVTGSTVNLRAGASTQAAVLGQTRRGDSAEVVELFDNGWARVYILENGQEAYMSAQFLERSN